MNKKKINIVIVGISYFSSMAGAMRVRNLFMPLVYREDGFIQNLIISTPETGNQLENLSENEKIKFRIISFNISNIFSILNYPIKCLLAIIKMKQKGYDNILYVYGYPNLVKIFIILFSKIFNYKIIFDIVEDNAKYTEFGSFKSKIKNYSSLLFIKRLRWFADGAIVISFHLKDQLEKIRKKKIPVKLIPISVDLSHFPSIINKRKGDDIRLFYGGSFAEQDNIDILLNAFEIISKSYPHLQIIMTGIGLKRHMEKFHKLLDKNASKDRIFYKGCLLIEDYYSTLNSCDIMCLIRNNTPFANGGFPFKLGEYLASGKAVIATDVSDIKYYLTDKINALVIKPDSQVELINAIEALVVDEDFRIRLGAEGRRTAQKYFDNRIVTENLYLL